MRKLFTLLLLLSIGFIAKTQSFFDQLEKQEQKENKLVIWEYGLPRFEHAFAQNKVAAFYGIYFNQVAGCVINDKLVKRIKEHNKKVGKQLAKKIGPHWEAMIYDAIDSVHKIDTTLINSFYIDRVFLDTLITLLDAITEPFEFRVNPTADPKVFMIDAFFIDKNSNVTDRSLLKIMATYPNITYRLIKMETGNSITQLKKHKVDDQ
jgi:aromatic ring-cleaving dioxygenase